MCLILASSFAASAHEYQSGDLVIKQPRVSAPLPGAKISAGYLVIRNTGDTTERLLGVSAGFAKRSELHTMNIVDGVARMRPLADGIEIPPGKTIRLERGGLHLMFMNVSDELKAGKLRSVKLMFEKAGTIEVDMLVFDPTRQDNNDGEASDHSADGSSDHSNHNH